MKKILIVMTLLACVSASFAEKISVFHDDPNAKIWINDQGFSKNELYNHEIDPGSYRIRVSLNGDYIYSKVHTVPKNRSITIDTNILKLDNSSINVDSDYSKQIKLEEMKKERGSFGIGFQLASVSGFSLRKEFGSMGVNVAGSFSSSDGETNNAYNAKLYFVQKEKVRGNSSYRLLWGLGYGYKDIDDFFSERQEDIYELFVGVERPWREIGLFTIYLNFRSINVDVTRDDDILTDYEDKIGIIPTFAWHYYF